jgi:hypothetical protein
MKPVCRWNTSHQCHQCRKHDLANQRAQGGPWPDFKLHRNLDLNRQSSSPSHVAAHRGQHDFVVDPSTTISGQVYIAVLIHNLNFVTR